MAEGGQFPWKRQVINESRGKAADYSNISSPLKLPSTFEWKQDDDREWRVVKRNTPTSSPEKTIETTESKTDVEKEKQPIDLLHDPENKKSRETTKPDVEKDFVYHTVLPSDTLVGICLRYGVTTTKLRQSNRFSGSNLSLAPPKLIIPVTEKTPHTALQDTSSPEYKLQTFLIEFPHLGITERRAYLEMNDWDLKRACQDAAADDSWERSQKKVAATRTVNVHVGVPVKRFSYKGPTVADEKADTLMEPLLLKSELELARRKN